MHTKLDEAKAELLTRAARVADSSPAGALPGQGLEPQAVQGFLQHYYLHTSPEDLVARDPVDVYGAALSHYRLAETICSPQPIRRPPILIGGDGEKKTLRLVAEHGDVWNSMTQTPADFQQKYAVLQRHCEAAGRNPAKLSAAASAMAANPILCRIRSPSADRSSDSSKKRAVDGSGFPEPGRRLDRARKATLLDFYAEAAFGGSRPAGGACL